MAKARSLTGIALLGLLLLAGGARAGFVDETLHEAVDRALGLLPSSLPAVPLPALPVGVGACIAATDAYLDTYDTRLSDSRDVALAGAERQRAEAEPFLLEVVNPDTGLEQADAHLRAFVTGANDTLTNLSHLSEDYATALGSGAARAMGGGVGAMSDLLTAAPAAFAHSVPWMRTFFHAAYIPLNDTLNRTLQTPGSTFSLWLQFTPGYLAGLQGAAAPPLKPFWDGVDAANRNMTNATAGANGAAQGSFDAAGLAQREGQGLAALATAPLGGLRVDPDHLRGEAQERSGRMTASALADAGTIAGTMQGAAAAAPGASLGYAAALSGCAR